MRRANKRDRKRKRVWRVVTATVLAVFVLLSVQLRPLMLDTAVKQLQNAAYAAINTAVSGLFSEMDLQYDDLITVNTDAAGQITALRANARSINDVKAQTLLCVQQVLAESKELSMSIPVGTLCGSTLLSGLGPAVPCRALASSVPQVNLQYHFDGAGINQTLHSILMTVDVKLSVTMPLQDRDTEVKCTFLIGETILVGMVPDNYTNVISDPEVADDIFNYGDAG